MTPLSVPEINRRHTILQTKKQFQERLQLTDLFFQLMRAKKLRKQKSGDHRTQDHMTPQDLHITLCLFADAQSRELLCFPAYQSVYYSAAGKVDPRGHIVASL
jgi:hypothetical protein